MTININQENVKEIQGALTSGAMDAPSKQTMNLYAYIFFTIMKAVDTALTLGVTRAKGQEGNVEWQQRLTDQLEQHQLKEIPKDCWRSEPVYDWVKVQKRTTKGHKYWTWEKRIVRYDEKVDIDRYNIYVKGNQMQLKIRQDIQNSVSLLQMVGNRTASGTDVAVKASTGSTAINTSFLDILGMILNKIFK